MTFFVGLVLVGGFSKGAVALTFDPLQNLSANPGTSWSPQIAASGSNLFVVWEDQTLGNSEVFFRRSTDGGITWDPPLEQPAANLSANTDDSRNPQIAVSGNIVLAMWTDLVAPNNYNLVYRRSTDGGITFEPVQSLQTGAFVIVTSQISFNDSTVHVVWTEWSSVWPYPANVFYRRSTDAGATFEPVMNLSETSEVSDELPHLAVDGSTVAVVWQHRTGNPTITFRGSTDGGATFGPLINLSAPLAQPGGEYPQTAVNGSNVYVVWHEAAIVGQFDILYRRSTDGGMTFEAIQNLSGTGTAGPPPRVSVSGANVYVVWPDFVPAEILFRRSTDSGATFEAT